MRLKRFEGLDEQFKVLKVSLEPIEMRGSRSSENAGEGQQEEDICAGANGQMFIRRLCGPSPSRVDDNNAPPALLNAAHSARKVWCCAEAAIGFEGVCAEHQEIGGPVEVGYGDCGR